MIKDERLHEYKIKEKHLLGKGTHSFKVRIEKSDKHSQTKTRRIFNKLLSEQPAIQKHMNLFICPVHGDTICLIVFLDESIEQL